MRFRRRKLSDSVQRLAPPFLRLALAVAAAAAPIACRHDAIDAPEALAPDDDTDDAELPLPQALEATPLTISTYDGSGESVHPDALVFATPWHGRRYWFAATPYPAGNPSFENPSIFIGNRANVWRVPGLPENPLARPEKGGYLSDPDLVLDPDRDELRLYFRQTAGGLDELFLSTSADGRQWSDRQLVLRGTQFSLISPTVVRELDGSWRMWSVSAGNGCRSNREELVLQQRRSADGMTWEAAAAVDLVIPDWVPWHWDVQYVPALHEYWALVAAYPDGASCTSSAVFFAHSVDGTAWTAEPTPLLASGVVDQLRDLVYRSSFRYHAGSDAVSVWFSGAKLQGSALRYGMAWARYPRAEMMRRVQKPRRPDFTIAFMRKIASQPASAARETFVNAFP
jgi:hypothetical protein